MASIRRTLSPYNGRHHHPSVHGDSPTYSPSHKPFSRAPMSFPQTQFNKTQKLLSMILHLGRSPPSSRRSFRKSSFRCLLFFLAGFVLGLFPFGHFDDLRPNDLAIEIKHPHANARFDEPVDLPLSREGSDLGLGRERLGRLHLGKSFDFAPRKQLIVVTPTYNRAMQGYFLNRVGQVLRLVPPPVLWIVVEMNEASMETAEVLRNSEVMYRHLVSAKNSSDVKDRGVHQRNAALEHIEHHRLDGIVYFADDDNVYTLELFDHLREIRHFGTWPVAMLAQSKNKAILEGPVCNGTQVIGWNTNEKSKRLRRFHVDMSGFAFNSTILWNQTKPGHRPLHPIRQLDTAKEGFQETTFIEQVVADESQMEAFVLISLLQHETFFSLAMSEPSNEAVGVSANLFYRFPWKTSN
ncbi:hypothetical protein MLD38_034838 [Melastoma candidum]|uniref:Uncharacterized protein n=1 Tax=Melastoma candidum TaxID=119954 RepID=A0ACB9MAY7_9MYRT|nr:hypothetical protein MLD38_034838 [Melastoma candidum]